MQRPRARAVPRASLVDHARLLAGEVVNRARVRRGRGMDARERLVEGVSACLFVVAATTIAMTVPAERELDPLVLGALVAGYLLLSRARFEYGNHYVVPEQLACFPMLMLLPLNVVPALMVAVSLAALLPDLRSGRWHRERWVGAMGDLWCYVPPVLVLAALAPGPPSTAHIGAYALALGAQLAADLVWGLVRSGLLDRQPIGQLVRAFLGSAARVDALLTPIAVAIALAFAYEPLPLLLALAALAGTFSHFSRDRRERHAATIELNQAYRGTVMLLSDVVECEDAYTAHHSRSVVELVSAVAERLRLPEQERQELEFAAMLHDVGKIAIPKEILNKPARLTEGEFELVKTHTVEGQLLLDRIGGLLGRVGEIVRSCHERWDGDGYPDGLAGEEIPIAARIVFACDAYNAMTTTRPYRAAMSREHAIAELNVNSGTQFDPEVVQVLVEIVSEGAPAPLAMDGIRKVLAAEQLSRAAV